MAYSSAMVPAVTSYCCRGGWWRTPSSSFQDGRWRIPSCSQLFSSWFSCPCNISSCSCVFSFCFRVSLIKPWPPSLLAPLVHPGLCQSSVKAIHLICLCPQPGTKGTRQSCLGQGCPPEQRLSVCSESPAKPSGLSSLFCPTFAPFILVVNFGPLQHQIHPFCCRFAGWTFSCCMTKMSDRQHHKVVHSSRHRENKLHPERTQPRYGPAIFIRSGHTALRHETYLFNTLCSVAKEYRAKLFNKSWMIWKTILYNVFNVSHNASGIKPPLTAITSTAGAPPRGAINYMLSVSLQWPVNLYNKSRVMNKWTQPKTIWSFVLQ